MTKRLIDNPDVLWTVEHAIDWDEIAAEESTW